MCCFISKTKDLCSNLFNFSQKEDRSDASSELSDLSGLNSSKTGPAAESTTIVKRDYPASTRESDLSAEPVSIFSED